MEIESLNGKNVAIIRDIKCLKNKSTDTRYYVSTYI